LFESMLPATPPEINEGGICMTVFSNDVDILRYEPVLFGDLHLRGQVLASGSGGSVSGTTFSDLGADFSIASVEAGGVIYLQKDDGSIDGAYEIVSVDSATSLTVSVLRVGETDDAIVPPAATSINWRVSTLRCQANEVYYQLTERFGLLPGKDTSIYDADDILDAGVLKQASVFAVISIVYAMLASSGEDENYWQKSLHYQKLFKRARERIRLCIDTGGDGICDSVIDGSSVKLVRR